jgi:hypothetical protein
VSGGDPSDNLSSWNLVAAHPQFNLKALVGLVESQIMALDPPSVPGISAEEVRLARALFSFRLVFPLSHGDWSKSENLVVASERVLECTF